MDMLLGTKEPMTQDDEGDFVRDNDAFRDRVRADGSARFPAAEGRYHLYVSWACPWAHRIIIVRMLKGLEEVIGMSVVDPIRDEAGWAFREGDGHSADPINGFQYLSEAYAATDADYLGGVTVPVLWDKVEKCIVSNADDDLMRTLTREFDAFTQSRLDLYPEGLREEIDEVNDLVYPNINDGVYRCGFAGTQTAYDRWVHRLFEALDLLESRLAGRRYLVGESITEADWRLFVTLIRFDPVYHGHFKCNLRRLVDYPHLSGYLRDLYQQPGIAETVNFDHIKRHYYMTHDDINPTRIVPAGPIQDLLAAPGRDRIWLATRS
jgi:putative glutathione S-transferase